MLSLTSNHPTKLDCTTVQSLSFQRAFFLHMKMSYSDLLKYKGDTRFSSLERGCKEKEILTTSYF